MSWTAEQMLSFAPDNNTADRAKGVATVRKWQNLAGNPRVIWGEYQGSGTTRYRTQIDLQGPAFSCTCPSRKFPCKHAIGLFLIYGEQSEAFRVTNDYPDWVSNWLEKRGSKLEEAPAEPSPPAPTEAELRKARNWERRLGLMKQGLDDLEIWLLDRIRQGLATIEVQNYSFWQNISARMVDAQLGGLASRLKRMPLLLGANTEWPERMLAEFAQLYLVIKGFRRLETLPQPLQNELLNVAGVTTRKDSLLTLPAVADDWLVLGILEGIDDNLNFRRTWLYGTRAQRWALLLEFSFGEASYPITYRLGQAFNADLIYYPSAFPLRAIVKAQNSSIALMELPTGYQSCATFLAAYAEAVSENPWLLDFPCLLDQMVPALDNDRLFLIDAEHKRVELLNREQTGWRILAISGGHPVGIFGEWTGELLVPMSLLFEGQVYQL